MPRDWRPIRTLALLAALSAALPFALAQADVPAAYPGRAVRLVVPFGAGSSPDVRARELAQKLAEAWRQPVVVENRPGAGGVLAMEQVAQSAPDGYTLVMAGQSALAIAPHLSRLRFDPLSDFAPVTRISKGAIILAAHPQLPVASAADLREYARRYKGQLNGASWGSGTITHLALELYGRASGIHIAHVPYKAAGQGVTELIAGQVHLAFDFYPAVGSHVKAGRLRALAVSGSTRLPALPDVPTFSESGMPEMEGVSGWQGVAAPAGTPRAVIDKVQSAVARVMLAPEMKASYAATGFETVADKPEEFAAFIRAEHARWGKLISDAGIRAD